VGIYRVILEGGAAKSAVYDRELRRHFKDFLVKGCNNLVSVIVELGGSNLIKDFFVACSKSSVNETVLLIKDAETEFPEGVYGLTQALTELRQRNDWLGNRNRVRNPIPDERVHFMVAVMESWFLCDVPALKEVFGDNIVVSNIPITGNIETRDKSSVFSLLENATRNSTTGRYDKVRHSPSIIRNLKPASVKPRAPHCARLFDILSR
jgi:hypothetical protein